MALHREAANQLLDMVLRDLGASAGQVFVEQLTSYDQLFRSYTLIQLRRYLLSKLGIRDAAFVASIDARRHETGKFTDCFDLPPMSVALEKEQLDKLLIPSGEIVQSWPLLRERYPNSQGVLDVAAPQFDAQENSALLYVGQALGPLVGAGRLWSLQRKREWKIHKVAPVWIA